MARSDSLEEGEIEEGEVVEAPVSYFHVQFYVFCNIRSHGIVALPILQAPKQTTRATNNATKPLARGRQRNDEHRRAPQQPSRRRRRSRDRSWTPSPSRSPKRERSDSGTPQKPASNGRQSNGSASPFALIKDLTAEVGLPSCFR